MTDTKKKPEKKAAPATKLPPTPEAATKKTKVAQELPNQPGRGKVDTLEEDAYAALEEAKQAATLSGDQGPVQEAKAALSKLVQG